MKRTVRIKRTCCLGLLIVFAVFAAFNVTAATAEKVLTVGIEDAYPPMTLRDSGAEVVGFEVDLLREIGRRVGFTVKFKIINWDKITEELHSKQIDLIASGLSITEERKKIYAYTIPTINNKQAIAVAHAAPIYTMDELGGKTVCTEAGIYSIPLIEQYKGKYGHIGKLIQTQGADACLRELMAGRVDAAVLDYVVLAYYVKNNPEIFRLLPEYFGEDEIAFGMRLEDKDIVERINKALLAMQNDGAMKTIREKWFGKQ